MKKNLIITLSLCLCAVIITLRVKANYQARRTNPIETIVERIPVSRNHSVTLNYYVQKDFSVINDIKQATGNVIRSISEGLFKEQSPIRSN